jgi:cephalosporin hydroxylase
MSSQNLEPTSETLSNDPAVSSAQETVDAFHKLYCEVSGKSTWQDTHWMGQRIFKCPLDLWIYQEIIFEQKPDVIIECGTCLGGSALFLAHMCDLVGKGRVYTIDIDPPTGKPHHRRLWYMQGSSTSDSIVARLEREIFPDEKVMVILDSDHHMPHVLNELRIYSSFVSVGGYIIVEDTNVNGHPVSPNYGPGPMEAIEEFFLENHDFEIDMSREKFYMTFNPRGHLKRVR